ncbi:hypothetical protein PTTG_27704 [Puccinia triticina 1-1 BBBD Race 1]|uniref:Secreted protein n=2 Tax=Puccinia triticina TaxID=208348 RepID=A0A180GIB4_PUCT1|nr:uncharacterized protein PtA15_8A242 [Puccinia triticina]OAV92219.1 hypothetical protein PTTG_27704 [Puccinia triticina 1-1 BBBD Race 1]WAQ87338.1 hypothetical protein PtA15_8A242 [Puccinia triticina]WAR57192.1 hypothetical protein PtB15_8B239 [Puccinia triticina]
MKADVSGLVFFALGLLGVVRAVNVTASYSYYPKNETFLHVETNEGPFNCPIPCQSYRTATGCTSDTGSSTSTDSKSTQNCSKLFGSSGAAVIICENVVGKETKRYSCTGVDPKSKFFCSKCTKISS